MEVVLVVAKLLLHRSPEEARFRKHSCNVGKHSRVEGGVGAHGRVVRSSAGSQRCSFGTRDRRDVGHAAEPVEVSSLVAGSDTSRHSGSDPGSPFVLDPEGNIRSARRGAAPGPSGKTADHLRVILESPDTSSFSRVAQDLARAQVPLDVLTLLTAMEKPGGGVRGIVCGDIVRRLVARTIAQSITPAVEAAISPRNQGGCVWHMLAIQSLTDLDSRATKAEILCCH